MVGQHPDGLELGVIEQVRLVEHEHGGAAAFDLFGGQGVGGLRDQGGVMGQRSPAQREHDLVVDATDPDGGVGQVDDAVAGRVERGDCRAHGHGFPGADLAGDHPDAPFGHAPADAGHGLTMAGVSVQHPRGQVPAERGVGEPEEPL